MRRSIQGACTAATRCFVLTLQDACTVATRCLYCRYKMLVAPLQAAWYGCVARKLLSKTAILLYYKWNIGVNIEHVFTSLRNLNRER